MRTQQHSVTFEMIEALAKKGIKAAKASQQLNINYQTMNNILKKQGVSYSEININTKNPQLRAWDTRKKNEAIYKYHNAETTGIKASIARKFKAEFGTNLKDLLNPKIEAPVKVRKAIVSKPATTKEAFKEKVLNLSIPYQLKELFENQKKQFEAHIETQNRRIEALEMLLMKK